MPGCIVQYLVRPKPNSMSSEKWNRVNELFEAAQKLPAGEWNKFLDENCDGDEQLKQEIKSLLFSFEEAGEFIQSPLISNPIEFLAEEDEPLPVHQQIGSYKIIKEIGRGGMGVEQSILQHAQMSCFRSLLPLS